MPERIRSRIHKKSLIALLIVAFLILGAASLIYVVWSNNFAVVTAPQSALVSVLSGSPEVSTDGTNFTPIKDGEFIYAGSTIRTNATTRALLVFSDNSVVTIDFNSQLKLDEITQNRLENTITIQQQLGKIFSQVEKIFGVNENYSVEAKGVIAAVRGTKFGSGILPTGEVRVYVKDSTVQIYLADPNRPQSQEPLLLTTGNQGIINPDEDLTGEQFNKDKSEYKNDGSDWDKLNDCLAQILDSIQLPQQQKYEYIQSKYKELVDACVPKTQATTPTAPVAPTPTAPQPTPPPPPATMTGISDNGDYTESTTITCNWSATNADKYSFAIGTYPGYTDTVNWLTMSNTSYSSSTLPLTYATKYFCTVLPTGPGGTAGWKTTDGIVYDPVTGSFRGSSTYNQGTWNIYDSAIVNAPAGINGYADVNAYYAAQCTAGASNGQYWNGTVFTPSFSWVKYDESMDGYMYLSNSSTTFSARLCSAIKLSEKLVNDHTGKVLQQL